jgi:formamidopyrimidine-DNA glycosylase
MPELPDLEAFAANLSHQLKGKKLQQLHVSKNVTTNASESEFKKAVEGQVLSKVYREGKELRMVFKNNNTMGIHFMLRGKFFWFGDKNAHKYTLAEWVFGADKNLTLTDYQANARITLNPAPVQVPDALSKEINEKFLQGILQSKASIKNLLLDQHKIRGIGNAYADEILWDAGISPFSAGNKIPAAAVKTLHKSIKKVLGNAVTKINTAAPGIIGGELRDFLLIHNAARKESPAGAIIKKKMAGGRPTYFTDEQEMYK